MDQIHHPCIQSRAGDIYIECSCAECGADLPWYQFFTPLPSYPHLHNLPSSLSRVITNLASVSALGASLLHHFCCTRRETAAAKPPDRSERLRIGKTQTPAAVSNPAVMNSTAKRRKRESLPSTPHQRSHRTALRRPASARARERERESERERERERSMCG
ncbi:hypothetical protein AOLI_G00091180 [Acnodon oligacanthus]